MKSLLRLLGSMAILMSFVGLAYSANTCAPSDNFCFVSGPSQSPTTQARLDSSGNLTTNGTLTTGGTATFGSYASLKSLTTTQINALTAPAGSIAFCSNCNAPQVCVSTAAATFSFALSTGTACK